MTSQIPRPDIYDPKTLAVMDQAFAAIWNILRLGYLTLKSLPLPRH
jgi:hypothetical protein